MVKSLNTDKILSATGKPRTAAGQSGLADAAALLEAKAFRGAKLDKAKTRVVCHRPDFAGNLCQ
jgi:hypothetical protein